jgi:hypothetical protein
MACAAACILFIPVLNSTVCAADNGRVIWAPSKTGDTSYKLRMGTKFVGPWDASAGAELSVSATKAGKVEAASPFGFWGNFSRKNGAGTARVVSEAVDIQFDAANGAGNFGARSTRRWIATRRLDFEIRRALTIQCSAYESNCGSVRLSHAAIIAAPLTGTALITQGSFANGRLRAFEQLGIKQKFGKLSLGAALTNPASAPRGIINAQYALKW